MAIFCSLEAGRWRHYGRLAADRKASRPARFAPGAAFAAASPARVTASLLPAARACYKRASPLSGAGVPTIFVLNGPNLNLLGVRDPAVYGLDTLSDIEARCLARAADLDVQIEFRQSNHEGQLVDWIHEARESADGIVLNAGALTHTSVAILDALLASELPVIEVHLSNIFRRERFRHHSYVSLAATGVICGLGAQGYELALEAIATLIEGEPGEAGR
jgi:3-dehydroquinate dehydratase-2